jgi:hypothetical protein
VSSRSLKKESCCLLLRIDGAVSFSINAPLILVQSEIMSHPLHPIHIIYDNNIIDDDVILTAVTSLILPEITTQEELSSSIRLSLISMGFFRSYSHNPVQEVDLGASIIQ